MKFTMPILALIVALLLVASQSIYTVDQTKYAIKFQLGEIVETKTAARPVLQGAAGPERPLLRQPQPDAREQRVRPRDDVREDAAAGRLHRALADQRREAVLRLRPGRRGSRAPPAVADGPLQSRRGVQQAHDARRHLDRARSHHDRDAAEGRRRRQDDRRRGRRRAAAPHRAAARRHGPGLPADGIGAPARGQRAAFDSAPRNRKRSAPTPTASGRSSSPTRTARRRRSRAKATPRPRPSTRRRTGRIRSSTRSTAASRPTSRRSATGATSWSSIRARSSSSTSSSTVRAARRARPRSKRRPSVTRQGDSSWTRCGRPLRCC